VVKVTQSLQKLFFLTGEGGTGKTRCIDAIQHFCNMWDQPNALVKTAMTGKAAVCVKGM
jgi:DNA repair ATPase RecN